MPARSTADLIVSPTQLRGVFYVAALASGILESTVALERDVAEALGRKSHQRQRDRRLAPCQHAGESAAPGGMGSSG